MLLFFIVACLKSEPEPTQSPEPVRSADWLATIPDSPEKRQVILGCTPCHPLGAPVAHRSSEEEWRVVVERMKKIDDDLDLALIPLSVDDLSSWLGKNSTLPTQGRSTPTVPYTYREYPVGAGTGFYHDVALSGGLAWVADYFGNTLYGVDPVSGSVREYPLPVDVEDGKPGGAHQLDVTSDGLLWMTFTKSEQVISFDPATEDFKVYNGFVPGGNVQYFVLDAERNIYEDFEGGIWVSHFSKEVLSRLDRKTGEIKVYRTPRTEALIEKGVHLYAAVADSNGRIWYTETHGNRYGVLDPKTGRAEEWDMPEPWSGPKRLAIDPDDVLWIPELATGKITVFDTKLEVVVDRLSLPIDGDYPYGIRRNPHTGDLWVTGAGSDSLYRLDTKSKKFSIYRLPRRGTYTRTVAFDVASAWVVYGSFPGAHTLKDFPEGAVLRLNL